MDWKFHAVLTALGLYLTAQSSFGLSFPTWLDYSIKGYLGYSQLRLSAWISRNGIPPFLNLVYDVGSSLWTALKSIVSESSKVALANAALTAEISKLNLTKNQALPDKTADNGPRCTSTYQYQPLTKDGEIRLLKLLPAKEGITRTPIGCQLLQVSLHDSPEYHALSYCWEKIATAAELAADQEYRNPILHLSSGKTLAITATLLKALREIQKQKTTSLLWVDQICINQRDEVKKSKQVALMKRIYSKATGVLVWLGGDADGTVSRAFQLARVLAHSVNNCRLLSDDRQLVDMDRESCEKYGIPPLTDAVPDYAAMIALLNRRWFTRAWVVQETSFSTTEVLSNDLNIPLLTLSKAMYFCFKALISLGPISRADASRSFLSLISNIVSVSHGPGQGAFRDLLNVLVQHRSREATLPQDKVFAFLALAVDADDLGIVLGYSLPAHTVFINIAVRVLERYQDLDILGVVKETHKTSDRGYSNVIKRRQSAQVQSAQLPSWVPNWELAVIGTALRRRDVNDSYLYDFCATGASKSKVQFRSENKQLGVHGYILDEVVSVGEVYAAGDPFSLHAKYRVFVQWEKLCTAWSRRTYEETGESMWSALAHCVTFGGRMGALPRADECGDSIPTQYLTYRSSVDYHEEWSHRIS
ncbi:hypothetical protein DL765_006366 [Monosporascus sp. GIB2]|nr:hypothetical protein DL765_006366 [Monosporascus sp. GIB2]